MSDISKLTENRQLSIVVSVANSIIWFGNGDQTDAALTVMLVLLVFS
jgi:hypothetical protein